MPRVCFVAGLWAIALAETLLVPLNCRSEATSAVVPALERHESLFVDDRAEAGRLLLVELNCQACHGGMLPAMEGFGRRKEAPDLGEVAGRVRLEYLRAMIADPQHAKPGTSMPHMPLGNEPARQHAVESLAHFLASTGGPRFADQYADKQAAKRGRQLFIEVGCAACHDRPAPDGQKPLASSFPLGVLGDKYSVDSLARFLRDPLAVRHSGRMPSLNLSEQESRDLANALVSRSHLAPNVAYRHYEGEWSQLPDFAKLEPKATGQAAGFDLDLAGRGHPFALEFEGFLHIDKPGSYIFYLRSDDGARLLVDGEVMVDHDGIHPESEQESDKHQLSAGAHRVLVQYFDRSGERALAVEFDGPKGVPRQGLAGAMTLTSDAPQPHGGSFHVDPRLAAEGARLFASAGCAACHPLAREGGKPIANQLKAPRLDQLRPEQGCLASQPPAAAPRFALSPRQRGALIAALATSSKSRESVAPENVAPETVIARTMATFNCYACHQRAKRGGVETARNDFFLTTAREMGDEGRIPPHLDGVGAKLTDKWLKRILERGAKDRPYMLTRMPRFGSGNVGHLAALFAAVDKQPSAPPPPLNLPAYRVTSEGRFLVGGRAFSCIKCHNFGKYQGEGIQAMDMTTMTQRLRPEWFRRYVRDPAALRPGTRMPAAWPKTGPSMLREVLGGDSDRQISAVWAYLSDGAEAAPPFGVGGKPIELVSEHEPIVYRNFITGAGPRGIAVGYPEKVNLALDGNQMQLVLIWRGPFIDAARHWSARSEGFQGPLGDQVLPLAGDVPLAELANLEQAWPAEPAKSLGYQFRGYDLDAQRRPKFHYRWRELAIDDNYLPISGTAPERPSLERKLELAGQQTGERLYFRAARSRTIEPLADGWFLIDKDWKMRLKASGARPPIVRRSDGQAELLVPINLGAGRAAIQQTFSW
jgi:mono/diheme cytochrome c family protein